MGRKPIEFLHPRRDPPADDGLIQTVVQQADDPTRFVLVEVYRTADAATAHKETAHYQTWRDTVAPMMAEPRTSVKYAAVLPEAADW